MVFNEPGPTRFDLRWTMFGTAVRVHPFFWLFSIFFEASALQIGFHFFLIAVACVFVSLLVHEFGHVWAGQYFGSHGRIVLHGFGGLAIGSNGLRERRERIIVSAAGPAAGFVFGGAMYLARWMYLLLSNPEMSRPFVQVAERAPRFGRFDLEVHFAISELIFINIAWGIVNLFPVWPLDGGMISREVCEGTWPQDGLKRSLIISIAAGALAAVHFLLASRGVYLLPIPYGGVYAAILFGLLAFQSYQLLQQVQAGRR